MASEKLKYIDEILYVIGSQLQNVLTELNISNDVVVYDERNFEGVKKELKDYDNTIFVSVNFGGGNIYSSGVIVPITITGLSPKGTFIDLQNLLEQFAREYTYHSLYTQSGAFLQQIYTTGEMQREFEEDGNNYRASIIVNATMVYCENTSGIVSVEIDNEVIPFLSITPTLSKAPNSADTGDLYGRVQTKMKFSTFSLTMTFVPNQNSAFCKKIDLELLDNAYHLNDTYQVKLTKNFKINVGTDQETNFSITKTMKILSIEETQEINGIIMLGITMVE